MTLDPCDTTEIERIVKRDPDDPFSELELLLDLRNALKKLSAYDSILVYMLFECQLSLTEIAERVGLTRQGVTRQVGRAVETLRKVMES